MSKRKQSVMDKFEALTLEATDGDLRDMLLVLSWHTRRIGNRVQEPPVRRKTALGKPESAAMQREVEKAG